MPYHTGKGAHSKGMKKSKKRKIKWANEKENNGQGSFY